MRAIAALALRALFLSLSVSSSGSLLAQERSVKNGEPVAFTVPFKNEGKERVQLLAPSSPNTKCRWIDPLPRLDPGEETRITAVCRFTGANTEEESYRRVDLPLFLGARGKAPEATSVPLIARVSASGGSQHIRIAVSPSEPRLVLEAASCPPLLRQAEALRALSKSDQPIPECRCADGTCRLVADPAIPSGMRELAGMRANCDGPNCFNAAFVSSGILGRIRHVGSDETAALLDSSRCSEVPIGSDPRPGDLIVIREGKQLIHGFTFITPELVFSKANLSAKSPYEFTSLESVLGDFRVPARCRGVPAHAAAQLGCDRSKRSSFFRCEGGARADGSAGFSAWRKEIEAMDCAVSSAISVGSPTNPLEFNQIRSLVQTNQALHEVLRKEVPSTEAERAELNLMRGEVESLYFQLKLMDPRSKVSRITH